MVTENKPLSKNLTHLLSDEAKRRRPSPLKQAFKWFGAPGVTSLGGGLPHSDMFPFDNLQVDTPAPPFANGTVFLPQDNSDDKKVHVQVAKSKAAASQDIALSESLQYGNTQGPPAFLKWIKEHNEMIHDVAYQDWDVAMTIGNTQALDASLRTFCNTGDSILAEEFTFTTAEETANGLGLKVVPVKVDLDGIIPEALEKQLDNWQGPKPKLMYTIPTGQNPCGSTLSNERRQAIYKLAQKHDFIILEDEPYYFLQMPRYTTDLGQRQKDLELPSHEDFLKGLVKSYLNFDTDGRVVRMDSFSKILSPGCRVGWVVGQERLIERYVRLHEVSMQLPSGFALSAVFGTLQRWGHSGYLDWLIQMRRSYTEKRNVCGDAMIKYFPQSAVEFIIPQAGMFFWFKSDARRYKHYEQLNKDPKAIEMALYDSLIKAGTHLIPGHWFHVENSSVPQTDDEKNALFFRGTFCTVPIDVLENALKVAGELLAQELSA